MSSNHAQYLLQEDVLSTYYDVLSLAKALPRFEHLQRIVTSNSSIYLQDDQPPLKGVASTRAFWAIMKALLYCDFQLTELTICDWYCITSKKTNTFRHQCSERWPSQVVPVLQGLTSLNLSGCSTGRYSKAVLSKLLLRPCVNLKNLTLNLGSSSCRCFVAREGHLGCGACSIEPLLFPGNVSAPLNEDQWQDQGDEYPFLLELVASQDIHTATLQLPNLESLTLKGQTASITPQYFVEFLQKHKATLKELDLQLCFPLHPQFRWEEEFEKLGMELNIRRAKLHVIHCRYRKLPSEEMLQKWELLLMRRWPGNHVSFEG